MISLFVLAALLAPHVAAQGPDNGREETQTYVAGPFTLVAAPWCIDTSYLGFSTNLGGACFDLGPGDRFVKLDVVDDALGAIAFRFRVIDPAADAPGPWNTGCGDGAIFLSPQGPARLEVHVSSSDLPEDPVASPEAPCNLPGSGTTGTVTARFNAP